MLNKNLQIVEEADGIHNLLQDHVAQMNEGNEDLTDNWIPNNAYTLAHSFRERYGNELSSDLVNDLLGDLNKMWRERERKQIARIKAQSTEEINVLNLKLSHRSPHD